MSTKPTNDASWDTNQTNLIAPTSGHKSDGFAVDEVPSSSEINGQLYRIGLWTTWLLDGDVSFDELAVDGSVTYTGSTNYSLTATVNNADPQGSGTTVGLKTLYVTPTASTWTLKGLVGGVEGREIEIINADFSTYYYFQLGHECAAATAANRFVLPALVTTTAEDTIRIYPGGSVKLRYQDTLDRWLVVEITGCKMLKAISIPAGHAVLQNGSGTEVYAAGKWTMDNSSTLDYPIQLPVGATIHEYSVHVDKNSSGAVTLTSALWARGNDDSTLNSPGDSIATSASGFEALSETNLDLTVSFGGGYYIAVGRTPDTSSGDVFYHANVKYWDLI